MAVLHRKEEKIQAVLGRLPKKYTQEQFVEMFIKLYSKDWGKIKSAYIKQSQDKEPGSIINMPKPEIYLKQVLTNYLQQVDEVKLEVKKEAPAAEVVAVEKPEAKEEKEASVSKPKKATKKAETTEDKALEVKKPKAVAKTKADTETPTDKPVKAKAVTKKNAETTEEKPKAVKKTAVKK